MGLLQTLFPGLMGADAQAVPLWEDSDAPWSILSETANGLVSQIGDLGEHSDGIFIHSSATIGEFVRIEAPCYVGANAEIRHAAYLRKGSWISDGAVVGHATEIKNSVLLPGSKAPHFNYVGDSILGMGVNLGAGAKLSNMRNDGREVKVTLRDGSRVDTGSRKVGALVGDGSHLGCNVVTNPGTIIEPGSLINPNETLGGYVFSGR